MNLLRRMNVMLVFMHLFLKECFHPSRIALDLSSDYEFYGDGFEYHCEKNFSFCICVAFQVLLAGRLSPYK